MKKIKGKRNISRLVLIISIFLLTIQLSLAQGYLPTTSDVPTIGGDTNGWGAILNDNIVGLSNYTSGIDSSRFKIANMTTAYPNLDTDSTDDLDTSALVPAWKLANFTASIQSYLAPLWNLGNLTTTYPNLDTDSTDDQLESNSWKLANSTAQGYIVNGTGEFNFTSWRTPEGTHTLTASDDGSNHILTTTVGGTNYFEIATTGTFLQMYGNPGAANDDLMFSFAETQGASTFINFYEGGTGNNRIWNSGSMRLGGAEGSQCTTAALLDIDCNTGATGADLEVQDDIWSGGAIWAQDWSNVTITESQINNLQTYQLEASAFKIANMTTAYPNLDTDSTDDLDTSALVPAWKLANFTASIQSYLAPLWNLGNLTTTYPNLDTDSTDDQIESTAFKIANMTTAYPNLDTDSTNDYTTSDFTTDYNSRDAERFKIGNMTIAFPNLDTDGTDDIKNSTNVVFNNATINNNLNLGNCIVFSNGGRICSS